VGFSAWGAHGLLGNKGGQFTSNREQRWTDPDTARRVPSKWTRGTRGTREARGTRGTRG
jgi:hypothetical protein